MIKKNSFIKKFNKLLISINERIESFFNILKDLLNYKKTRKKINLKKIDKKIPISFGAVIILSLCYILIPSLYDEKLVKTKLENQILQKYNLEVKFDGSLRYGFLPKPHFFVKDTIFTYNEKNLAKSNLAKIYISAKNFFSLENIQLEDLVFDQTEFNITSDNFSYFKKILNSNKSEYDIIFKNSNLFYKDRDDDVIFLTNIKYFNFIYNDEFTI